MKVLEIRPDSKLRELNFDGYKLSLEAIPILKLENISVPHQQSLDLASEYSFIHSSLFKLHNHLITDPWLNYTAYYVDSTFAIQKVIYDLSLGKLKPPSPVYKFKRETLGSSGNYNCDIKFLSEKYAVLSDGVGGLKVLETGDRQRSDEWKCLQELKPLENGNGFIVYDGKFLIENGERQIHCLLLHIRHDEDGKFFNVIEWITIKQVEGSKIWELCARRTVEGRGSLHYLSLDPKCKGVVYSSDKEFKYVFDSVNAIVEEAKTEAKTDGNMEVDSNGEDQSMNFKWTQNGEDISVIVKRDADSSKTQFKVSCTLTHLEVQFGESFLLNFDLFDEIDVDMMNWTFEKDHIQVNLVKKDSTMLWPFLTPGGPPMEIDEKTSPFTQPVADLNSQMEDCDFEGGGCDEYFLDRLDAASHKISHRVFLSSNHPILTISLRPGHPKAIGLRNEVDCCLWLQHMTGDNWSLRHESTLHAFGYVQASKQGRKYLTCSPDTNLSLISESSRHLFIYNKNYSSAKGLRNRSGPQMTIGQQKVVTLSNDEIIGIVVENEIVLILTETSILCLQLSIEE